jgi:hypothetical protein
MSNAISLIREKKELGGNGKTHLSFRVMKQEKQHMRMEESV